MKVATSFSLAGADRNGRTWSSNKISKGANTFSLATKRWSHFAGSAFLNRVGQFVAIVGATREMLAEQLARLVNRMHHRVGEVFRFEVFPHRVDQPLPEFISTTFVNPGIADHGKGL
jgi:hypothetical protein